MEDIDDEQIIQLLLAAEVRMAKSNTSTSPPGVEKTEEQRSNRIPKLEIGAIAQPYISSQNGIASADHRRLIPSGTSSPSPALIGEVRKPVTTKKASKATRETAGSSWYDLPRTVLTNELKRDLQLLRMRDTLDPKRFYKKDASRAKVPEFSQIGTIIQGPTEYFSARLEKKERKQTLTEEILTGEAASGKFKSQYQDVQSRKRSGKKMHYKVLKAQRGQRIRR